MLRLAATLTPLVVLCLVMPALATDKQPQLLHAGAPVAVPSPRPDFPAAPAVAQAPASDAAPIVLAPAIPAPAAPLLPMAVPARAETASPAPVVASPVPAVAGEAPATTPPADAAIARDASVDQPGVIDELVTGAVMTERDMLQYCVNISDQARETRYAIIERELDEKKAQIEEKLVSLAEKMRVIKEYVETREKFRSAAEDQVVAIYRTMKPDAAAQQLAELDTGLSAAIILKLEPKVSSLILTEMQPKQAAQIANYLTAAMQPPPQAKPVSK